MGVPHAVRCLWAAPSFGHPVCCSPRGPSHGPALLQTCTPQVQDGSDCLPASGCPACPQSCEPGTPFPGVLLTSDSALLERPEETPESPQPAGEGGTVEHRKYVPRSLPWLVVVSWWCRHKDAPLCLSPSCHVHSDQITQFGVHQPWSGAERLAVLFPEHALSLRGKEMPGAGSPESARSLLPAAHRNSDAAQVCPVFTRPHCAPGPSLCCESRKHKSTQSGLNMSSPFPSPVSGWERL